MYSEELRARGFGYHATHSGLRKHIVRHGLLPAHPAIDGNYVMDGEYVSSGLREQPRGVYVSKNPITSWASVIPDGAAHVDVWAVHFHGLPVADDPQVMGALAIQSRVPTGRLALVPQLTVKRLTRDRFTMSDEWHDRVERLNSMCARVFSLEAAYSR